MDRHDDQQHGHAHGAHADRSHGSGEDFERDWQEALRTRDPRWFLYPDAYGNDQVSLVEWVKAEQVTALLRQHGIQQGRILEYGCGAAGMSVYLKEQGYQAHCVDLSVNALKVAQINDTLHRTRPEPLRPVAGDAMRLPFSDGVFDVVMSYGLLEHFDEVALDVLLPEVTRVLRPGGLFVADIIPSRLNARAVATCVNMGAASVFYTLRGQPGMVRNLSQQYFGHYFETSFGPDVWEGLLRRSGLNEVAVQVCRPFPQLAIWGRLEAAYTGLMRALLPLWRRFDGSSNPVARQWGWMYLASGVRPAASGGPATDARQQETPHPALTYAP